MRSLTTSHSRGLRADQRGRQDLHYAHGAVGSVGVVVLHAEDSKFNDEQGFKYTYVSKATGSRGNPHEPLSERAEKDIQSRLTGSMTSS